MDETSDSGIDYVYRSSTWTDYQQAVKSGGAAPGDYDNDGWVDLYVTRIDSSNILYRNQGDGTFEDVTEEVFGADHLEYFESNGCAWADIDNDGDLDLYVTHLNCKRYHLFVNDGEGGFTEDAGLRGVAVGQSGENFGYSIAFGDYDRDGFLDLYVTEWRRTSEANTGATQNNRLFRNLGAAKPGYFEDVTDAAGVATDEVEGPSDKLDSTGYAPRFCDIDRDGHPDILLAADNVRSRLFWNNGDGTFTDGTNAAGVGTDRFGMGSAVGDVDLDGDLDWFVTSIYKRGHATMNGNRLYRYDGERSFADVTNVAGVRDGSWGWAACFCDFDHDGDLDLIQTNGVPHEQDLPSGWEDDDTRLWENNGSGVFTDVAGPGSGIIDHGLGKGMFCFDYDRDGDMDVFMVNNDSKPILYRNETATGDWLMVRTEGRLANRQGIGCFITVNRGGGVPPLVREMNLGSNFLAHDEPVAHFGLGTLAGGAVESVVVEWPCGVSQTLENVAKNSVLEVVEPTLAATITPAVGDGYELSWNSATGWWYKVEACVDLSKADWEQVTTTRATGPAHTVPVAAAGTEGYGFYRVATMP